MKRNVENYIGRLYVNSHCRNVLLIKVTGCDGDILTGRRIYIFDDGECATNDWRCDAEEFAMFVNRRIYDEIETPRY